MRYARRMNRRRVARPIVLCLAAACLAAPAAAQDAAPSTDTPETLAAMRALLPPLPAEIPAFETLPADVRGKLANFRLETHRWHADPAQRFVVVDGRRVEAGGVLGQELWLREIGPDRVVLQYRDTIFWRAR